MAEIRRYGAGIVKRLWIFSSSPMMSASSVNSWLSILIFAVQRGCAQQGAGNKRLLTHKGQCHLRRIQIVFFGQRHVFRHRAFGLR